MTPDQISKLPPAIKLVADDLRHAGCLGEDDSYRLLTWGLQMQEERDAAQLENNRLHITAEGLSTSLGAQRMITQDQANRAETAEATIATLTRDLQRANEELNAAVHILAKMELERTKAVDNG